MIVIFTSHKIIVSKLQEGSTYPSFTDTNLIA